MRAYSVAIALLLSSEVEAIKINNSEPFGMFAQQQSKLQVTLHNRVNRAEIKSFAQSFREQLANAKEAVRLAAVAEDERNAELTLAGLADPKKKNNKANELLKKLDGAAPANASKASNKQSKAGNTTTPANASKTKAGNATAPANASKAANATAPANSSKAANATTPAGNATAPAGNATRNATNRTNGTRSGGAGFAPGAEPPTPAEADAVAAEADGEKADVMYRFAKKKVDDLIAGIKALDEHIKKEFLALEKILTDIEIDATFDPESAADIAWITTEIGKILEDSP